jgi:hemolysin activation/secretion protein
MQMSRQFKQSLSRFHIAPVCLAVCFWVVEAGAQAQPQAQSSGAHPRFAITGFVVTGDNPIGEATAVTTLAPFVSAEGSVEKLQQATAALENALRLRGFGLHKVVLAPQELGSGPVRLDVIRFSIGKITVDGAKFFSDANHRASVPELVSGGTPNFNRLAIQTGIANENPSKKIQVAMKEGAEPDQIDAAVQVEDISAWSNALNLTNTGSPSSGRDRLTYSLGHANVFDRDHQVSAAWTTSVERPSSVRQFGLSYRVPLYAQGGVFGVTATHSNVVGNFGTFNSTGAGQTLGASYVHHFEVDGGLRQFATVALDDKLFKVSLISGIPIPNQSDRRSRPLSFGYSARFEGEGRFYQYNVDIASNMGGGTGNSLAAYQSEDPRISNRGFTALRLGAQYSGVLMSDILWSVRGQLQRASTALISGEQFGIGGSASVRGAGERPLSGDHGAQASVELTSPELATGLRMAAFFDAGWVADKIGTLSKPESDRLSSAGIGVRFSRGPVILAADYGRIVTGSRMSRTVSAQAPEKGDDKLHLNVSVRF